MKWFSSAAAWAVVAASVLGSGSVAIWAAGDGHWPGTPNGCREVMRPNCFCEWLREGAVSQPSNTWSNLGFIGVGIAIGIHADRARGRRRRNTMTTNPIFPAVFAAVTAMLGPGNMALHATMTIWGGRIDVVSMYAFIGLVAAHGLGRLLRLSGWAFAAIYVLLVATLGWTKFSLTINSDIIFGVMVGVALGLNVLVTRLRPEIRLDSRFLLAAVGLFLAAFAIWVPSRTGGPLCDPQSWLQGHAIWHGLCALSAGAVYLYLASEEVDLAAIG